MQQQQPFSVSRDEVFSVSRDEAFSVSSREDREMALSAAPLRQPESPDTPPPLPFKHRVSAVLTSEALALKRREILSSS